MVSKERGSREFKPRFVFFLFVLVCFYYFFWLTYQNLGVFVGSLRADEIHFLQNAWMAYSGQTALEYVPPLYHYVLVFFYEVFGGSLNFIYTLRFFNFLLFCVQGFLVFRIFLLAFPALRGRYFSIIFSVLAVSFVTTLSAFRGYEIRPEGLGNTLLLFGIFWLFLNCRINSALRYMLYLAVCASLVIAASLSFRFVLPSFFLWIAAAVQMLHNNELTRFRGVRALWLAFALSLSSILIIDYLFVDWGHVLEGLDRYSSTAAPMDWITRFTINTWSYYAAFCLLILGLTAGLGGYAVMASKADSSVRQVNALLFLPILSFYLFLSIWDVNPRAYIHSIEWILILGLALFSVRTAIVSRRASLFALRIFVVVLLISSQKGISHLSSARNSQYFLDGIWSSLSSGKMSEQDDSSLVKYFGIAAALPDQINSRREFCVRHRGSFVISGSILYHPICLVDMGTYDFSGWGNKKVDLLGLPPDRSLIILAATAEQLAPLNNYYGDRYKSMPNISIISGGFKGEVPRR